MNHAKTITICLMSAFAGAVSVAQSPAADQPVNSSSHAPVAYVYVADTIPVNGPDLGPTRLFAFAADATGKLTPVAGSPFNKPDDQYAIGGMVDSGGYLFGTSYGAASLHAFKIESNGVPQFIRSQSNPHGTGYYFGSPALDHQAENLYVPSYSGESSLQVESFKVEKSNGQLEPLGAIDTDASSFSFSGSDKYAYAAICENSIDVQEISTYERESNGALKYVHSAVPPAAPADTLYCPAAASSDPDNHVAVALEPLDTTFSLNGNTRIAVYSSDSEGKLSTFSTSANMTGTAVGYVGDMKMSPSGKQLAVAGGRGLQIFTMHGDSPVKPLSGILADGYEVDQIYWDNANHLYAISGNGATMFVYTVSSSKVTQAPGSPYNFFYPVNVIAHSLTAKP